MRHRRIGCLAVTTRYLCECTFVHGRLYPKGRCERCKQERSELPSWLAPRAGTTRCGGMGHLLPVTISLGEPAQTGLLKVPNFAPYTNGKQRDNASKRHQLKSLAVETAALSALRGDPCLPAWVAKVEPESKVANDLKVPMIWPVMEEVRFLTWEQALVTLPASPVVRTLFVLDVLHEVLQFFVRAIAKDPNFAHRDLKPEHIGFRVGPPGRPPIDGIVVFDLGGAKVDPHESGVTTVQHGALTPRWAAPEQVLQSRTGSTARLAASALLEWANGRGAIDNYAQWDLYTLGAIAGFWLTLDVPSGATPEQVGAALNVLTEDLSTVKLFADTSDVMGTLLRSRMGCSGDLDTLIQSLVSMVPDHRGSGYGEILLRLMSVRLQADDRYPLSALVDAMTVYRRWRPAAYLPLVMCRPHTTPPVRVEGIAMTFEGDGEVCPSQVDRPTLQIGPGASMHLRRVGLRGTIQLAAAGSLRLTGAQVDRLVAEDGATMVSLADSQVAEITLGSVADALFLRCTLGDLSVQAGGCARIVDSVVTTLRSTDESSVLVSGATPLNLVSPRYWVLHEGSWSFHGTPPRPEDPLPAGVVSAAWPAIAPDQVLAHDWWSRLPGPDLAALLFVHHRLAWATGVGMRESQAGRRREESESALSAEREQHNQLKADHQRLRTALAEEQARGGRLDGIRGHAEEIISSLQDQVETARQEGVRQAKQIAELGRTLELEQLDPAARTALLAAADRKAKLAFAIGVGLMLIPAAALCAIGGRWPNAPSDDGGSEPVDQVTVAPRPEPEATPNRDAPEPASSVDRRAPASAHKPMTATPNPAPPTTPVPLPPAPSQRPSPQPPVAPSTTTIVSFEAQNGSLLFVEKLPRGRRSELSRDGLTWYLQPALEVGETSITVVCNTNLHSCRKR